MKNLTNIKAVHLSELLTVILEEFIPKLYQNYVSLNVRYTSKHKKYVEGVPHFLCDCPCQLVLDLLDKIEKVTEEMKSSIVFKSLKLYLRS